VQEEAAEIFRTDSRMKLWEVGEQLPGPTVFSLFANHLDARWAVRAATKRVSEAVWSAIEQHYSGPTRSSFPGEIRRAAEKATSEREEREEAASREVEKFMRRRLEQLRSA
jgi:hypothetical protein